MPDQLDQPVAAVPVSLRELGDESMNNQITMMLCSLATDIAGPIARIKAINGSSTAAKGMLGSVKGAISQDYAFLGAPLLLHSMISLYGQSGLAHWTSFPANLVISNVPGPVVPQYVGEAKVSGLYPVSIPTHGCALNITVQSYLDELDFRIAADRRAVPDAVRLLALIAEDFAELSAPPPCGPRRSRSRSRRERPGLPLTIPRTHVCLLQLHTPTMTTMARRSAFCSTR